MCVACVITSYTALPLDGVQRAASAHRTRSHVLDAANSRAGASHSCSCSSRNTPHNTPATKNGPKSYEICGFSAGDSQDVSGGLSHDPSRGNAGFRGQLAEKLKVCVCVVDAVAPPHPPHTLSLPTSQSSTSTAATSAATLNPQPSSPQVYTVVPKTFATIQYKQTTVQQQCGVAALDRLPVCGSHLLRSTFWSFELEGKQWHVGGLLSVRIPIDALQVEQVAHDLRNTPCAPAMFLGDIISALAYHCSQLSLISALPFANMPCLFCVSAL